MSEVKVVVGAITRRRLDGLQKLFESYAAMKRPEGRFADVHALRE